jgi:phosphoribosyl-ATP pyrophosphohydrolase/phosphoribosyl-AMP cyclohydrolase
MLKFDSDGLIPAVVQHARSGEVLMLGYMNAEALHRSRESGLVTFWSRSRGEFWQKGATSGNFLHLVAVRQDCDGDALLLLAEPDGPTCHTGRPSCFHRDMQGMVMEERLPPGVVLTQLIDVIRARAVDQAEGSYTVKLLRGGVDRIGKKIGEEASEVIIAAKNNSSAELTYEMADLLYHSLVLLECQGVSLEGVLAELQRRAAK